jgi:quinol monooxygenase YgiN
MAVFSIWESRFPSDLAAEGRRATAAIWKDMLVFDGYLRHEIVEDLDDPGHLFVISEWASRAAADEARDDYRDNENAQRVDALVKEPRKRTLGRAVADT